jgi:BCD family chlorophyll transporter-like MFS transporter
VSIRFGYLAIFRIGLVQMALGMLVVLSTSTLNRVMVVELALPALVPGLLVALHHLVQLLRPRWGYGSDRGGRRTPWIIGGMVVLALGTLLASVATAMMAGDRGGGGGVAVAAFIAIGIGVGACGTNLLVLLAQRVADGRRAAAATLVWVMMIGGFVLTGALAGAALDPFSMERLVAVTAGLCTLAVIITLLAVWRLEPRDEARTPPRSAGFAATLGAVWAEGPTRRFTVFVLLSMLAYSMQDLILEPFAGIVFGMSPGETTRLAGLQNGGTLAGMVLVALASGLFGEPPGGLLRRWILVGCLASATSLAGLVAAALVGPAWPIRLNVVALGLANGAFAVAAIGSMMGLAGRGGEAARGTRMGLWGAAQAIGFGFGGLAGACAADAARTALDSPASAFAVVFALEAALFLVCSRYAANLEARPSAAPATLVGLPHFAGR